MDEHVPSESRFKVYDAVTEKIVAAIKKGAGMYVMPWHGGSPPCSIPVNASTKAHYRGVNILALWAETAVKGYSSGNWASYRQWKDLGAQVRRGERGTVVVFFKKDERSDEADEDEHTKFQRLVARAFWVFNAAQVEGWDEPPAQFPAYYPIKDADALVKATGAQVRHGGAMARYMTKEDVIEIPNRERFIGTATSTSTECYYAVLLHELTHWSGAPHRLNREFGKRFGDHAYAFEELVAELGAAFLSAILGMANEPRQDHAAYVSSWLEVLNHDHKAIFTAASQAQKAAEYLGHVAKSNGWKSGTERTAFAPVTATA